MSELKQVVLYRAFYGERNISISLSEEAIKSEISESIWHEFDHGSEYSYDSVEKNLEVVNGSLQNWGNEQEMNFHVHWNCPGCSQVHHTDIEKNEIGPAAWFCEMGSQNDIFLVKW